VNDRERKKRMKTMMGKAIKFMALPLLLVAAVVGCGKKGGNNAVNNGGYTYINGQCVQNGTNTVVPSNYCQNGQYQLINGQCMVVNTNQVVDPSLCYNNGNQGCNGGYNGGYGGGYNGGYNQGCNGGYNGGYGGGGYPYPSYPNGGYGGYSQSCYGQYYITNGFTSRIVWCNGYDCRGSFLYNYQTRTQVYCQ
jgi:hypothetical protein